MSHFSFGNSFFELFNHFESCFLLYHANATNKSHQKTVTKPNLLFPPISYFSVITNTISFPIVDTNESPILENTLCSFFASLISFRGSVSTGAPGARAPVNFGVHPSWKQSPVYGAPVLKTIFRIWCTRPADFLKEPLSLHGSKISYIFISSIRTDKNCWKKYFS